MALLLQHCCLVFWTVSAVWADTFHLSTAGKDEAGRDGKSEAAAWRSLAFACEQVPAGEHTIRLGAGTFVETRTAFPNAGVTIEGQGNATVVQPADDWPKADSPRTADAKKHSLIAIMQKRNCTIRNLALRCKPTHRLSFGAQAANADGLTIERVAFAEFRWTALHIRNTSGATVAHCRFHNGSTDKDRWHGGALTSKWIKHSEIHHCLITADTGGGYGYKAGGHERLDFHHNVIELDTKAFAFESAHEHEFGVEIHHNYFNRCTSIPKGGQSSDPASRDCEYSFWIHDNLLTDSYTIEGPRNHLRVERNHIRIEKPNGRVYTHHGGRNNGPVWFHHNLIENVDRAVLWMNEGLAENLRFHNNTVRCAVAGERKGALFGAYTAERLNGWIVRNNVLIAPPEEPRAIMATGRGVPGKITADHNLCVNVTGGDEPVAAADFAPGGTGWRAYLPKPGGNLIGAGVDVGLPFEGEAPNLGAFDPGESTFLEGVPTRAEAEAFTPDVGAEPAPAPPAPDKPEAPQP